MPRSLLKRSAAVGGIVAVLTLAIGAPASAHVGVKADNSSQGGYATVTFKVPNESDEASTTKLEVNLPVGAPVASVSLRPVAGWTGVAVKTKLATPIEAHGSQITEAVSKITWTASGDAAIKPGQFQTFDVSMGPLPKVDQMVFKSLQTYSDGNVVRWIDEPTTDGTEPESPAPTLKLTVAGAAAEAPAGAPAVVATPAAPADGDGNGTAYGIAGIAIGLAGLILGLLAYRRAGQKSTATATTTPETVSAGKAAS